VVTIKGRFEPASASPRTSMARSVDLAVLLELREVVDEGGVDHAIRRRRSAAQALQILQMAAMDLGTRGDQRLGPLFRAGQPQHLMPRPDEILQRPPNR
jgi:hypothetical protein